ESRGVTRSTLVLAPGCKTGEMTAKRWPHFAALAGRFADVAVVGTEDDLRGHDGAPMAFPAHVRSLVGALSLRETAEVMAAAGVVVANDSGLGHLAGATGVPTLLLFGPTADAILGPFPPNVTVLRGGLPCEPCWNGPRLRACAGRVDCLQALAADRVEREVRALLGMGTGDREMVIAPAAVATWPVAGDGVASEEIVAGRDESRGASEDSARPDHPLAVPVFPSSEDPADGDPSIPFVSCLMPTRDRRRFVAHAVEQFLRQDHPRRELVVVDDGADPVADLVPADPRVRYHRVERQRTLGGKRNLACRLARGDLLAHWDDDDWMPPHRLSAQVRALANVPRAEACGLAHIRFFDPAAERAWEYRWPERSRPWVAGGTLLFRRRLWERHPFPELNEGEDTRWVWSLPLGTLAAIPDPGLYAALVHTGNTSRKRTGDSRWHPIPLEVVRGAMGDDWSFYAAPSSAPRRVPA
ncbi:MAG TPA: glycosyltransferase family 9 protein, partial [Longimicrobium sp.]|nr:glycosyltransferase family 9 protein [Longimicrobium sp.]